MPETPEQLDAMFPRLDAGQIARLMPFGQQRSAQPGEILYDQGDVTHGVFVILDGSLEVVGISTAGEAVLRTMERGMFTGEVNQISGRRSLVRCRAREASSVLEISRTNLQRVMQTDVALGDLLLRAFLLRRGFLIDHAAGDALLVGSSHSSDTLRLREFLTRNGHPLTYIDLDRDADAQALLDHFHFRVEEIPVLICRGEKVLRNPTNAEAAECFGLNEGIDEAVVYDLIVVGAGPAGLGCGRLWRIGGAEGPGGREQFTGRASRFELEN